jgi:hypothetical protein
MAHAVRAGFGSAKARAGRPSEAAQDADAILFAVHWSRFEDVLSQAGDLSGKSLAERGAGVLHPARARRSWRRGRAREDGPVDAGLIRGAIGV